MTTAAPPPMMDLAKDWDWRDPLLVAAYPSAVFSGIIPDADHLDNGGYHVSIEDLIRHGNGGDYSNSRPLDIAPPVTTPDGRRYAAAMDMSMARADMARHYRRVRAVYDDRSDPRRAYLGYVNTWDGDLNHAATRFDFQGNRVLTASADHKWHVHTDWPRAYVDVRLDVARVELAMRAYRSVILGETVAQWLPRKDSGMRFFNYDGQTWRSAGFGRLVIPTWDEYDDHVRVWGVESVYPEADENGRPTVHLDVEDPDRPGSGKRPDGGGVWTEADILDKFGSDLAAVPAPVDGLVPHTHPGSVSITVSGSGSGTFTTGPAVATPDDDE